MERSNSEAPHDISSGQRLPDSKYRLLFLFSCPKHHTHKNKQNNFFLFQDIYVGEPNFSIYEILRTMTPFILGLYIVKSVTQNATSKQQNMHETSKTVRISIKTIIPH